MWFRWQHPSPDMNLKHVYIILLATGILPLSRTTIIKTWENMNNNKKKSLYPYLCSSKLSSKSSYKCSYEFHLTCLSDMLI